jgi:hypothetical protein
MGVRTSDNDWWSYLQAIREELEEDGATFRTASWMRSSNAVDVATEIEDIRGHDRPSDLLARLDPDVRAAYPTDEAVNRALRSLLHQCSSAR